MKKIFILLGGILMGTQLYAQQPPTSSIPNDPNSALYWSRSGNTPVFGQNNIFGTLFNSPIYTETNTALRSKMNGTFTGSAPYIQYNLNGYLFANGVNTSGYMLLGNDLQLQSNGAGSSIYRDKGAFSMLHLNGTGTQVQELGYRPWMQTGITFTGNNDLSYFGLRQIGSVNDRTETTICWSDNGPGSQISDEMVFRFTGTSSGVTSLSTNFFDPNDYDGLHVARFTPTGRFGLGNTFGHIDDPQSVSYNTPQSLLHMSYQLRGTNEFEPFGFLQITYRRFEGATTDFPGEGEQATDGLRLGIDNQLNPDGGGGSFYLNSYLRWQETSSFVIQTESETDNNVENDERLRVSSVGALVTNFGTGYLGNIGTNNRTRIGISADGSAPVTKPMSLMHLGANVPASSGWRNWMDIGTYTTNGNDNMYVGLKNEAGTDRQDAVINWGDNYTGTNAGPDNMRFIFTANNTGTGPSITNDGLEGMRLTPTGTTGVFTGVGGAPSVNPYGPTASSVNPTATLEVNSWGPTNANGGSSGLRFTNLNTSSPAIANPGQGFLSVNASGDVIYTYGSGASGATCGSPANVGFLSASTRLNLNNNNYYFANLTTPNLPQFNRVAVGYNCNSSLPARFNVLQLEPTTVSLGTVASYSGNGDIANAFGIQFIGSQGKAIGIQTQIRTSNIGGYFSGFNAELNYGVKGEADRGSYPFGGNESYGGYFIAQNSTRSYGVYTRGYSAFSTGIVYGIYATASGGDPALTRAGYFDGLIQTTSSYVQTSDSMFKKNVKKLNGSLKLIQELKPVSYDMDLANYPQMHFDDHLQFGYIAQDVENVLPNLVYESFQPSTLDSLGNPVDSSVTYKALNYNGFVPINTQAIIELNQKVDKITLSDQNIKTNVQDLDSSLQKVLEMRGVSYDWNHTVHPELNLDSANHIGFIAQELQQVDPRLTYVADDSLLHVEYDKVVPILAEAIKELNGQIESKDSVINVLMNENSTQQATIDDLNARLSNLENCLLGILPYLCQLNQSAIQANTPAAQEEVRKNLNVTLNNRTTIILDQNVPNPFAEQTVINFSIPATVQKAQILFYDGNGKLIQSVDITERGLGSITVFGSDLSFGTYTYSLVADGQIVATKKMVKQ